MTSRAHFDVYLIRYFAPIYHVEVEIVWAYTSPTSRTTTRKVLANGAAGSLPPAQKTGLTSRYTAYAYIR